MPGLYHGVKRGLVEILIGVIVIILLKELTKLSFIDSRLIQYIVLLVILYVVLSAFVEISKMKYWSTLYLMGVLLVYIYMSSILGFDLINALIIIMGLYILFNRIFSRI